MHFSQERTIESMIESFFPRERSTGIENFAEINYYLARKKNDNENDANKNYAQETSNVFYLRPSQNPEWYVPDHRVGSTVRAKGPQQLGQNVLGHNFVGMSTRAFLEYMTNEDIAFVQYHELLHELYPLKTEREIRDLQLSVMGYSL